MFFDVGLSPLVSILITTLLFAILSDLMLDLYSVRMSLSTGRLQRWFFNQFGQNLFLDFLFAHFFQFLSYRKKNFLLQFSSLVTVGSFSRKQILMIVLGSAIGFGFSMLIFLGGWMVGTVLCLASFTLSLMAKDQIKDFAIALLALGVFLISLHLFSDYLAQSAWSVHQFHFEIPFALIIILFVSIFFRTPLPFLLSVSMMHSFVGLNIYWIPILFFIHSVLSHVLFYKSLFQGYKRLHFLAFITGLLQVLQLTVAMSFLWMGFQFDFVASLFTGSTFLASFYLILIYFFSYHALSLILLSPLMYFATFLPFFNRPEINKDSNQKIMIESQRGRSFSIHFSFYLLRQEFKKYVATAHTVFKMSRDSDTEEEKINNKISRYQLILRRVGDELKDVCFSIGRERSYRWQVREVMNTYRLITQIELLIDDLSRVIELLQGKEKDSNWEKDCRLWLSFQLKIFESFFYEIVGVENQNKEKIREDIDKSHEILKRFVVDHQKSLPDRISMQTFFRVTESLTSLNRIGR